MNPGTKNKLLLWLVGLLLLANAATIAVFWWGRKKTLASPDSPREFLVRELKLDTKQQEQYGELVKEHRRSVEELRKEVRSAKDKLFELIGEPGAADSTKKNAAAAVSKITEEIDLLTVNHFQKVRALCSPEQQKKFDNIIQEVTRMMARPGPPPEGPPHEGPPPPP